MKKLEFFLLTITVSVILVYLLVFLFMAAKIDAKCLEKGYPKAAITWNFKGYCLTIDGVITPRVEELINE